MGDTADKLKQYDKLLKDIMNKYDQQCNRGQSFRQFIRCYLSDIINDEKTEDIVEASKLFFLIDEIPDEELEKIRLIMCCELHQKATAI